MAPMSPPSAATATADAHSLAQSLLVALAQWAAAAQASSSGSEPGPADIPHPTAATTALSSWTSALPEAHATASAPQPSAAAISDWLQQQLASIDTAGTIHLHQSPPEATIANWGLWDKVFWVIGVAAVWIIGCLGLWGVLAAVVSQERRRGEKANGERVIEDDAGEANGSGVGEVRREWCSQRRSAGNLQSRNGETATVQTSHAPPEGGNSSGIRDRGLMQTQAEVTIAGTAPGRKEGASETNRENLERKASCSVHAEGNNLPPIDNLGRDRYQAARDFRLYGINDTDYKEKEKGNGEEIIEPGKGGCNHPQSQNAILDSLGRDRHQLARDLMMYGVHANNTGEDALLSTGLQPPLPMHKCENLPVDDEKDDDENDDDENDDDDKDDVEQNQPPTSDLEAKITEYKAQIRKLDGGSQLLSPSLPTLASTFIRLKAEGKIPMGATFDEFKRLREKVGREGGQAQGSDLNNHHHHQSRRTTGRFKSAWADKCSLVPQGSKKRRWDAGDEGEEDHEDQVAGEDEAQELATTPSGAYTPQLPVLRCAASSTCLLATPTQTTTTTGTERRMTPESLTPRSDYNGEGWSVTASEGEATAESDDSFVGGDEDGNDDDDSDPEDQQRVNEHDALIPESASEMLAQMVRRVDRRWWW